MFKKIISIGIVVCVIATLGACAYQNQQQRGTAVGAGVGAAVGAIVGQAAGGDTEATLWGAAIGAMVGGAPVTQAFAQENGADGYAQDAVSAVTAARDLVNKPAAE